jgi:hypothetical protein
VNKATRPTVSSSTPEGLYHNPWARREMEPDVETELWRWCGVRGTDSEAEYLQAFCRGEKARLRLHLVVKRQERNRGIYQGELGNQLFVDPAMRKLLVNKVRVRYHIDVCQFMSWVGVAQRLSGSVDESR